VTVVLLEKWARSDLQEAMIKDPSKSLATSNDLYSLCVDFANREPNHVTTFSTNEEDMLPVYQKMIECSDEQMKRYIEHLDKTKACQEEESATRAINNYILGTLLWSNKVQDKYGDGPSLLDLVLFSKETDRGTFLRCFKAAVSKIEAALSKDYMIPISEDGGKALPPIFQDVDKFLSEIDERFPEGEIANHDGVLQLRDNILAIRAKAKIDGDYDTLSVEFNNIKEEYQELDQQGHSAQIYRAKL